MNWILSRLSVQVLLNVVMALFAVCAGLGLWIFILGGRLENAQSKCQQLEIGMRLAQESHLAYIQRVNKDRETADVEFQRILDETVKLRPIQTKTITKIIERTINENPGFAQCVRSDELHAERVRQLEAIRKAAPN